MIEQNVIIQGNCLEIMRGMPDSSIDSIVTDPPYGIRFMSSKWDYDVPAVDVWKEALRVLKPGGHMLCACGTRTQHRMAVNIEDAGFEIRDIIAWLYGSGMPKSLNVGIAVDKLQGRKREVVGVKVGAGMSIDKGHVFRDDNWVPESRDLTITKGSSEWEGWGTSIKPAMELWTLARRPLSETNVAKNVLKWGTGGINIDGCRIEINKDNESDNRVGTKAIRGEKEGLNSTSIFGCTEEGVQMYKDNGRFPANVILDEEAGKMLDGQKLGVSRFFYCAKASTNERNEGLEDMEAIQVTDGYIRSNSETARKFQANSAPRKNIHPTVKPVKLMQYLCRMITPRNGIVLDPFTGSGSTLIAAKQEKFNYIGIELNPEYVKLAEKRLNVPVEQELL